MAMELPAASSGAGPASVPLELWGRLLDVADRFYRLAPWTWMPESAIFGVRLPGGDTIGFVSIMGSAGKHRACAVYLGWQALRGLRQAIESQALDLETFLEIPQLQLGFENRAALRPPDLAPIRALGRRYRGRQAWPVFRSHRVGYLPWTIDLQEAGWLLTAVEQSLGIAMRCEDHPGLLPDGDPDRFLVRTRDPAGAWQDEWLTMPRLLPATPAAPDLDDAGIAALRRKPAAESVQVDLMLSRAVIGHKHERPQAAYLLLVVDAASGFIFSAELLQALAGVENMWHDVPRHLLKVFHKLGGYPPVIEVRGDRMMSALRPLSERLPFRLTRRARLAQVEAVRESFDAYFGESPADALPF